MSISSTRFRLMTVGALACLMVPAAALSATPSTPAAGSSTSEIAKKPGISDYLGLNYFTFFDGPGLGTEFTKSPSALGRPGDDGWSLWTNLSVKGKISSNLGVDLQLRLQQILTNDLQFRYQGARLGTSGTLLRLERPGYKLVWSGALNSDIPGAGQMNTERKLIVNPGLFSNVVVRPTGSRFSLFALVAPRVWIYSDADAMDRQSLQAGFAAGQKPQAAISMQPSINYDLSEKTVVRTGIGLDVRKNANSDQFVRWFMPIDMGVSHTISPRLTLYPHVRFSGPWDNGLRERLGASSEVSWTDTASVGLWLNGTIL